MHLQIKLSSLTTNRITNRDTGVAQCYQTPKINASEVAQLNIAVINSTINSMEENNTVKMPQVFTLLCFHAINMLCSSKILLIKEIKWSKVLIITLQ
jgi:hypothetical protein